VLALVNPSHVRWDKGMALIDQLELEAMRGDPSVASRGRTLCAGVRPAASARAWRVKCFDVTGAGDYVMSTLATALPRVSHCRTLVVCLVGQRVIVISGKRVPRPSRALSCAVRASVSKGSAHGVCWDRQLLAGG